MYKVVIIIIVSIHILGLNLYDMLFILYFFSLHSLVLLSATIVKSTESELSITCHFKAVGNGGVGCVVVWSRRDDPNLNVATYPREEVFPAAIPISEAGQYSVAVFGKNDRSIEREPVVKQTVRFTGASSTQGKKYFFNTIFCGKKCLKFFIYIYTSLVLSLMTAYAVSNIIKLYFYL